MAIGFGAPFLSGGAADPRLLGVQDYLSLIQSMNPAGGGNNRLATGPAWLNPGGSPGRYPNQTQPPGAWDQPSSGFNPAGNPGPYVTPGGWGQPSAGMSAPGGMTSGPIGAQPPPGPTLMDRFPNMPVTPVRWTGTPDDQNQLVYKGGAGFGGDVPSWMAPDPNNPKFSSPGVRNLNYSPPPAPPRWVDPGFSGNANVAPPPGEPAPFGRQPYALNGVQAQQLDRLPPRYWEMVNAGMSPADAIRRGEAFQAGQLPGQQGSVSIGVPGGPTVGPRQPFGPYGIDFPVGPGPNQAGMTTGGPIGVQPPPGPTLMDRFPNMPVRAPRWTGTPDQNQLAYKRGVPYGNDGVARRIPPAPRQKLPQEPNVKPPQRDVRAPKQPKPMIADEPPLNQAPARRPQRPLVGGGRWSQYR